MLDWTGWKKKHIQKEKAESSKLLRSNVPNLVTLPCDKLFKNKAVNCDCGQNFNFLPLHTGTKTNILYKFTKILTLHSISSLSDILCARWNKWICPSILGAQVVPVTLHSFNILQLITFWMKCNNLHLSLYSKSPMQLKKPNLHQRYQRGVGDKMLIWNLVREIWCRISTLSVTAVCFNK